MRVFLFVVYYLPSYKSCAKLFHDLAIEFNQKGYKVTVITLSEDITNNLEIEHYNKIDILRIKSGKISSSNSRIIRGINEILISYRIWKYGKHYFLNNDCDLIVWYSPTIFFGKIINKLKNLYKAKTYLVLRDIFPDWAWDTGQIKNPFLYKYFKKKEYYQYDQADTIGVQSPSILNYFIENKLEFKYNLEVLYNWTKIQRKKVKFLDFRTKYNLKNKIIFFYGGNIGVAQDIDNIVRLAKNLVNFKKIHFLLVGDGSEFKRISNLINEYNLINISIYKSLDQDKYLSLLSEVDVGIISLNKKFKTSNYPGKMLGYMEFKIPILLSSNKENDLINLLDSTKSGLVSINGDDQLFMSNTVKLFEDIELRKKMGNNAFKLLNHKFSSKSAADQIFRNYEK